MATKTDNRLTSILVCDDFINYIMNPTDSLTEKWEDYLKAHPDQIPIVNEARHILLGELEVHSLPVFEKKELEVSIFEKCGLIPLN